MRRISHGPDPGRRADCRSISTITGVIRRASIDLSGRWNGPIGIEGTNGGDATLLTMFDGRNHVHRQATLPLPESVEGESRGDRLHVFTGRLRSHLTDPVKPTGKQDAFWTTSKPFAP